MSAPADAIVVGGGPAGALTAHLLARRGARVVLLEAADEVRRKVCGEYLCPRGVEILRALGLEAMATGRPIEGMRIVSPNGTVVQARFPAARGRSWRGLALDRRVLETALLEEARSSGAEIAMGARVTSARPSRWGWSLTVRSGGAAPRTVEGALLIGADGRRSVVAEALGLARARVVDRVALHGHFMHREPTSTFGEMHLLAGGSYLGVDPTGEREVNVSLVCDARAVREHGGARAAFDHHLRAAPDYHARYGRFPAGAVLKGASPITHDVRSAVARGAALVGDAAGFLDPLTGEGIYQALFGARALADALAGVRSFSHDELAPALRRYARARAGELALKRRLNRSFQWLIERPALIDALARAMAPSARRANAFLGTVGNVYGPVEGLVRTIAA